MPANHKINTDSRVILTTWEGDATDAECFEALQRYQENIINKSEYYSYNEVVSFVNVADVKVTAKGLMDLAKLASTTEQPGIYTKLAIVVNSSLARSFANLYATYRNVIQSSNKEMQVFKNEDDALIWVSE